MIDTKDYTEVFRTEGFDGNGRFNLKLLIDIPRDFTETDHDNIQGCVTELISKIKQESSRLNPKNIEQAAKYREDILALFKNHSIFVEEIPNGYSENMSYFPWFQVTTKAGRIIIGWRKRVINIDWTGSIIEKTAQDLFHDEQVTKVGKSIHADNYEKAKEYIETLLTSQ